VQGRQKHAFMRVRAFVRVRVCVCLPATLDQHVCKVECKRRVTRLLYRGLTQNA
jgi:hypothetical protein